MRKVKVLFGLLALLIAATTAISFNNTSSKLDLYYYNSDNACVTAPCETNNHTDNACLVRVYSDSTCQTQYLGTVWSSTAD